METRANYVLIGLEKPDAGSISINGREISGLERKDLNEVRKKIGFLFQQAALYDSMTVERNVEFPLERHTNLSAEDRKKRANELLASVGMDSQTDKLPAELSGGMKKRAGLARALALDPDLVFLDEPTSGLDPIGAGDFDELVSTLQRTLGLTVFMVTHDLDSLYTACDRIAVLGNGKIIAAGSIADMKASKHPWLNQYFNGKRARAVVA